MHKNPRFRALGPCQGQPVMLDDTCYFLPCSTAAEASILTALCNDPITRDLSPRSASVMPSGRSPRNCSSESTSRQSCEHADRVGLLSRGQDVLNNELPSGPCEPLPDVVARLNTRSPGTKHEAITQSQLSTPVTRAS